MKRSLRRIGLIVLAVISCSTGLTFARQASAASLITVTSNGHDGIGTLRWALAQCPSRIEFGFIGVPITIASTLVVNCPNAITIQGRSTGQPIVGVPDRVGRNAQFAPIAYPATEIINYGGRDGLLILSNNVTVNDIAIRGTYWHGSGDLAIDDAWNTKINNVALGVSQPNGLNGAPSDRQTRSSTVFANKAYNTTVNGLVAGMTEYFWGNVVFQQSDGLNMNRVAIVGSSIGTVGPSTLDALTFAYGTRNVSVSTLFVDKTSSSSAVEIHQGTNIRVDQATLLNSGRAGMTVYDGHNVTLTGSVIDGAGTCGTALGDQGGVTVYTNSSQVTVSGTIIEASCGLPTTNFYQ